MKSVMIVGVGGQGTLLASRVLGRVMLDAGYDVKVSEVHGMSQRGGSVVTYVRWGERVESPVINEGEADFSVSGGGIRYGLSAIKSIGRSVIDEIVREREENGLWRRGEEVHEEFAYQPEGLEALLRQAGFRRIKQYGELRMTPPRAGEGRIFFAARKDT